MTEAIDRSLATDAESETIEVDVCDIDDLTPGVGRAFEIAGQVVAVFLTRAGQVRAVENRCPHRGGPLADGILANNHVVCPFHANRYDLTTGACSTDSCSIAAYPARIASEGSEGSEGDARVLIQIPIPR
ncbi:MAG TPA: Rieske 2Fe-2S domain-containing protein [Tepidisphaeraceae bacterium]|jgi:nitrite reductase (NADH) small subunit